MRACLPVPAFDKVLNMNTALPSTRPTVGVLIRYARASSTLPRVMAALQGQTLRPDRILGVDSSGCVACGELIRSAGGEVLRWHEKYEPSRVLNHGLRHLPTELVLVLGSHTVLEDPRTLEHMVAAMLEPRVACVSGKGRERNPGSDYSDAITWQEIQEKGLKFGSFYSNNLGLLRRSCWVECPFDENLPTAEDYAWALEQVNAGHVCRRLNFPFTLARRCASREKLFSQIIFQLAAWHHVKPAWPGVWNSVRCLAGCWLRPNQPDARDLRLQLCERLKGWGAFHFSRPVLYGSFRS